MKKSQKINAEILALCNYAESTMNGKFNIIGIFDQMRVEKTTGIWPHGFIVFTIKTPLKNTSKKIRVQIVNNEEKSILNALVPVNIGGNGKANFLFEFANIKVTEFGGYTVKLLDPDDEDALIGETDIMIFPGESNEKVSGREFRAN